MLKELLEWMCSVVYEGRSVRRFLYNFKIVDLNFKVFDDIMFLILDLGKRGD